MTELEHKLWLEKIKERDRIHTLFMLHGQSLLNTAEKRLRYPFCLGIRKYLFAIDNLMDLYDKIFKESE